MIYLRSSLLQIVVLAVTVIQVYAYTLAGEGQVSSGFDKKTPIDSTVLNSKSDKLNNLLKLANKDTQFRTLKHINQERFVDFLLRTNISSKSIFSEISKIISKSAPSLKSEDITVWVGNYSGTPGVELVVGYLERRYMPSNPSAFDPFLALWLVKDIGSGCKVVYLGSYMNGDVLDIRPWAAASGRDCLFLRHQACIECEPYIELSVIDFGQPNHDFAFYEFQYEDKSKWNTSLGLSFVGINATESKTRIAAQNRFGVSAFQFFKTEDCEMLSEKVGPNEWWVFHCDNDGKCPGQLFKKTLPDKYQKDWEQASKINF
jgi:hypothetical protein